MADLSCGMMKLGLGFLPIYSFTLALASFFAAAAEPAVPKAASSAEPVAISTDDKLELYACRYGRSLFPETSAFRDGRKGENVEFVWGFYVARSGAEVTLIDTGFSDPAVARKWHVNSMSEPAQLLADLKIDPAKVARVIITHIHF